MKWFNAENGFGFIVPDGDQPDVFVRWPELSADTTDTRGKRTLHAEQRVRFDVVDSLQGPQALAVTPIANTGNKGSPDSTEDHVGPR
ncbi:cold shock domain-containing protein [Nocardia sp. NPDC059195]|uniref:cold shock domain-containing protein n=1 Tax=Nocardia sp. NPDC059195 TaxID=3346765 RepID=UPI0036CD0BC0